MNPDNYFFIVGKNIKKYRELRNYSLQVLAEKVGVTKKTIHRYENGEHKISNNRLIELSSALNVTLEQLTEGTVKLYIDKELERAYKEIDGLKKLHFDQLQEIVNLRNENKLLIEKLEGKAVTIQEERLLKIARTIISEYEKQDTY